MKRWKLGALLAALTLVLPLTIRADQEQDNRDCDEAEHFDHNSRTPIHPIGAVTVPGNPILSADIGWVDPGTERYYIADRSNNGVDILDAEESDPLSFSFVGRVGGMAGPNPSGGGTAATNGPGPNGVVVTPNHHLWVGDGNATVQVADVDPASANYLSIIKSVSTAIPACDGGPGPTGHYCGRADEIGYDPHHHVILIAHPGPRAVAAPHALIAPYATFISADPPFAVQGTISFPGAGGLEQPLWDPGIQRFLLTVPGKLVGTTVVTKPMIAVLNPTTRKMERQIVIDCAAKEIGTVSADITGIALAPFQHILVSACGFPIVLSALVGPAPKIFNVIRQVGGGDEVWFNPGDDRFYVTGPENASPTGVQQLGVIDAQKSRWLQNVPDVRGRNPAAFAENNRIFTVVTVTSAMVAAPATDNSICATNFNIKGRGCIALFQHRGNPKNDDEQ